MRAAYYETPSAGFARLPVATGLTALLGGGALMGGRFGGDAMGGLPSLLEPAYALARDTLPATGDSVTWGWAGVIGAGAALLIALASDPRRKLMALVAILALAFFGLLLLRGGEGAAAPELPALTEVAEIVPELPALPEAPPLACPDGTFAKGEGAKGEGAKGEGCLPCTVAEPERPALLLSPVPVASAWRYASDDALSALGQDAGATRLSRFSPDEVCRADAVLALGSASSDGERDRNRARARRRAERLADRVADVCSQGVAVYAASLGQSSAARDVPADRAVTLLTVDAPEGEGVARAAIERELGYLLSERAHESPLLGRLEHFDQHWSWVEGGAGTFSPVPQRRPVAERLRADAPASCERPA